MPSRVCEAADFTKMIATLGEAEYRRAGLERLVESRILTEKEFFAGGAYLAGRAVESMLRSLIWKFDSEVRSGKVSLATGHDLRDMLVAIENLGVLADYERRDRFSFQIQSISRLWFNNMRFVPYVKLKALWWQYRVIGRRRTLKKAISDYYNVCADVVKMCEVLCQK